MPRVTVCFAVVVIAITCTLHDAGAAAKKRPGPAPVTTTYYFHGHGNGNVSAVQARAAQPEGTGILPMDAVKPTAVTASDYFIGQANHTPNHTCFGNSLSLHAAWIGKARGTLVDKITVSFYASSIGGNAVVQIFADAAGDKVQCREAYPNRIAETLVPVPASATPTLVTTTFKLPKPVKVLSSFAVQIQPEDSQGPQLIDIAFDGAPSPSNVTWTCRPKSGKTC